MAPIRVRRSPLAHSLPLESEPKNRARETWDWRARASHAKHFSHVSDGALAALGNRFLSNSHSSVRDEDGGGSSGSSVSVGQRHAVSGALGAASPRLKTGSIQELHSVFLANDCAVQAFMENFHLHQCHDAPLGVMLDAIHQSEHGGLASLEAFGSAADPSEAGGSSAFSSVFDVPPWERDRSQTSFLQPNTAMKGEFPCAVAPALTLEQPAEIKLAFQSASADAGSADALALHFVKPTHPFFDVRRTCNSPRSRSSRPQIDELSCVDPFFPRIAGSVQLFECNISEMWFGVETMSSGH